MSTAKRRRPEAPLHFNFFISIDMIRLQNSFTFDRTGQAGRVCRRVPHDKQEVSLTSRPVNNYLNVQTISFKYNSWDILTFYGSEELLLNLISKVYGSYTANKIVYFLLLENVYSLR